MYKLWKPFFIKSIWQYWVEKGIWNFSQPRSWQIIHKNLIFLFTWVIFYTFAVLLSFLSNSKEDYSKNHKKTRMIHTFIFLKNTLLGTMIPFLKQCVILIVNFQFLIFGGMYQEYVRLFLCFAVYKFFRNTFPRIMRLG